MMDNTQNSASQALNKAREALRNKNLSEALRWAEILTKVAPEKEEGWLILAACSKPDESVKYLVKALDINPNSERARQGMDWAVKRLRKHDQESSIISPTPEKVLDS